MKKEIIFVVDGNWYLHRVYFTLQTKRPIGEVLPYKFLNMVYRDALAVGANYLLIAFDGPAVFRYDIYPEYKSGRRKTKGLGSDESPADSDLYQYLPQVFSLALDLNTVFYQPKKHEADDVLRSCANHYSKLGYSVICGTQDKDAFQYLDQGKVKLYDSSAKDKAGKPKPRYITAERAEEKLGIKVSQMVDYQVLIGDKGDSVPKIQGMGPAKARSILAEYGSIRNWYENSKEDRPFIDAQRSALRRNRKLVTLVDTCLPPNELQELKLPKKKSEDKFIGSSYHMYHDFLWPRRKSLF